MSEEIEKKSLLFLIESEAFSEIIKEDSPYHEIFEMFQKGVFKLLLTPIILKEYEEKIILDSGRPFSRDFFNPYEENLIYINNANIGLKRFGIEYDLYMNLLAETNDCKFLVSNK